MQLNDQQTEAVRREKNVVVSAGAGSGKTSVLAMRYLRLVKEGRAGVENILTLTYTRKAAAEMYERIHALLLSEGESETVRRELKNFENAQISTIDSFCTRIVRNDPARFGIPGSFSQDTEAAMELSRREALDFILRNRENRALQNCILRFGFNRVWNGLFASLANEYFSLAENHDFSGMAVRQRTALEEFLVRDLTAFMSLSEECLGLGDTHYSAVGRAQASLIGLPDPLQAAEEGRYGDIIRGLKGLDITKKTGSAGNEVIEIYKDIVDRMKEVMGKVSEIAGMLDGWSYVEPVFGLCGEFQEEFIRKKRAAGVLTFRDVAMMALEVLKENLSVRQYYKEIFRYIMIDEFQDNNRLQKDILYLLAERTDRCVPGIPAPADLEPDKLFFVGDQKQSIYRFRGADVSVIKELSGELSADGTGALSLSMNYRSEPGLIDFFNSLFSRVMENAGEAYEADFSPLESRPRELEGNPLVSLFYKPYDEEALPDILHADDAEAYYLAHFIKDAVERRNLEVSEDGIVRPAEYGDFALLMRSTGNQIRYERMFRLLGVPYVTQDVRALFLEAPVNDLYAALECAVYPEDRLALASFLRSPFVNISDQGFVRILSAVETAFQDDGVPGLSEGDAERYSIGTEIIRSLRERIDRETIVGLLYYLWYDRGYRYVVLRKPSYHGYLEYFDYLREYASLADMNGLCTAEFLDQVRPHLGNYERMSELSLLRSESGGVHLMTIHKSKGLQFPVVLVANMGNAGRSGADSERPYYLSEEYGVAFNLAAAGVKSVNYFYSAARDEEKARDMAELKRLLYVAATRAKNHLVFSGCHNRNNRSRDDVLLNILFQAAGFDRQDPLPARNGTFGLSLKTIPDVTGEELLSVSRGRRGRTLKEAAADYAAVSIPKYRVRRDEWAVSELNGLYAAGLPAGHGTSLQELEGDALLIRYGLETEFGTFCHLMIERTLEGLEEPDLPPALAALREDERRILLNDAGGLARGFLAGSFFRSLPRDSKFYPERSLFFRYDRVEGPLFLKARPDLFIETGDRNILIDFKTDRHVQEHHYAMQLTLYIMAAGGLNGRETDALLYYLRDGMVIRSRLSDGEVRDFLASVDVQGGMG